MSRVVVDMLVPLVCIASLLGVGAYAFGFNQGYKKAYFKEQDMSTKANFISIDTKGSKKK